VYNVCVFVCGVREANEDIEGEVVAEEEEEDADPVVEVGEAFWF